MKILTVENIANALQATLVNGEEFKNRELDGAAIDSRKVEKDNLFFAIKGENVDGHDYIKAAFDNGAGAVVCERVPEGEEGICIVVENTVEALKKLAAYYREQLSVKVVGVTGSIGKTTTKEFIATVLSQKYNVFRTEKNQNNLIGLPLSILNIKETNEIAVLEMGISEFGEMSKLSEIAKPDICVITNISACHLETLGSLDGVFKAKTEIFEHMNPEGSICVCGDDERLAKIDDVKGIKPVTFGFDESNTVHTTKVVNRGLWGSEITIDNGDGIYNVSVPLAGRHMIIDALAAASVAKILDVNAEQVSFGISCVKALSGRNNLIQKNSITIIDDCYNASPESMKSALDLLTEAVTPTVAILGDMFEQGENEDRSHEEIGAYAVEKGINTIVCVGPLSKKMYDKAQSESAVKENIEVHYFETVDDAINNMELYIKKDDTVLIKASNGMKFNRILEALTSDEKKDSFTKREEKLFKKAQHVPDENLIGAIKDVKPSPAVAPVVDTEASQSETAPAKEKSADQKERAGATKQLGIIIGIVAAAVIIGLSVFGIVKHNNYKNVTDGIVVYVADAKYQTKGIVEDNVLANTADMIVWDENDEKLDFGFDGKYFYYAASEDNSHELYICDKNGKNRTLLSKNVISYDILKKGNILYQSGKVLYTYNAKKGETNLVAENVNGYYLNKKKKAVIFNTADGGLYFMKIGKTESTVLMLEGVRSLEYADSSFKNIFYKKDDGFYLIKNKKKEVSIAADAANLYFPENEKTPKVYFNDSDNALWYFSSKKSKAEKVTDEGRNIYGKEFGYAGIMSMDKNGDWNLIRDGKEYKLKDFSVGKYMRVVGADKKKVYFVNMDGLTNIANLYSVSHKGLSKKKETVIESSNVSSVEYLEGGRIFVCKEDGMGNMDLYEKEKLVARNVEPGSVQKTEYGKDFVFAYQVSDEDGFYKIVLYNGKNIKDVGSSIDKNVVALSKKKIYLRTKGESMFNIKTFNGKKIKTYKEGIVDYRYIHY